MPTLLGTRRLLQNGRLHSMTGTHMALPRPPVESQKASLIGNGSCGVFSRWWKTGNWQTLQPMVHGMATSPCRLQSSIRLIERIHLHLRRELAPALRWIIGIAPNPEPDLTHVHDVRVPEK